MITNAKYLFALVLMVALTLIAIVVVVVNSPDKDNTEVITLIVGLSAPTTVSLLTYMKAQQTHLSVNSRLDDFISSAKETSLLLGREEGRQISREEHQLDKDRHDTEGA